MSHYAKIEDGVAIQVIVAEADHIATLDGDWVKTSYNMYGGFYYDPETNAPAEDQSIINGDEARERKNYASVGYTYNGTGFHAPQPFPSWSLDSTTYLWEPPVPYPEPKGDELYEWNENTKSWDEV